MEKNIFKNPMLTWDVMDTECEKTHRILSNDNNVAVTAATESDTVETSCPNDLEREGMGESMAISSILADARRLNNQLKQKEGMDVMVANELVSCVIRDIANMINIVNPYASGKFTKAQSDVLLRNWSEEKYNKVIKRGCYDPSRERLNFEVSAGAEIRPVNKGKSIPERIKGNLKERGIVDPNDNPPERATPQRHDSQRRFPHHRRRIFTDILFSGKREWMRELAFGSQEVDFAVTGSNQTVRRMPEIEEWARDIYRFVTRKWGEENIASFIVHFDEPVPHIHCVLLNVTKDNKVDYRACFGGGRKAFGDFFLKSHEELAEVNRKWGIEGCMDKRGK